MNDVFPSWWLGSKICYQDAIRTGYPPLADFVEKVLVATHGVH